VRSDTGDGRERKTGEMGKNARRWDGAEERESGRERETGKLKRGNIEKLKS
jgi:hypothetical protein